MLHLREARERHVCSASAHHSHVRNCDSKSLNVRSSALNEPPGPDGDAAANADSKPVGLSHLGSVYAGTRAVDIVDHDVDRLVEPLPKDRLCRGLCQQHACRRDSIHGDERRHAPGQEHLLPRDRVHNRIHHALRLPELEVRSTRRVALPILLKQCAAPPELLGCG
eukprot:scaffold8327_cov32-Tisochrysis_lutea.AAC.1